MVIALDTSGQASGELYLDDGKSFAYERGIFAHRAFTFKANTLTSTALAGAAGKAKEYKPDNDIERIIVLGLPSVKGKWQVSVEGTGASLDAAAGPVALQPGLPDSVLVVRKPGLSVASDWSLTFTLTSASA